MTGGPAREARWEMRRRVGVVAAFAFLAPGAFIVGACELLIHDVSLGADGGVVDAGPGPDAVAVAVDGGPCGPALSTGAVRAGVQMVLVASPLGSYCIDTLEVTVADFNAYLVDSGAYVDTPDGCAGTVVRPLVDNDPTHQTLPITNVGECNAWSYCRWAQKRLCGTIGDGGVATGARTQDTEWGFACVNGVANTAYPYGIAYDASVCNTEGAGAVPVGSLPGCHGTAPPFDRIYDLSGNAYEYVNDIGNSDFSVARPAGGSWQEGAGASCDFNMNGGGFWALNGTGQAGFRCCADRAP
jgi:formylglycine-generating enzyme required for sulfatase activity